MAWDDALNISSGGSGAAIDDNTVASDKVWSSSKVNTELAEIENVNVLACWFEQISSGTGGTLAAPTGATINLDAWPDGVDCVVSETDALGKPTYETPESLSGVPVTGTLGMDGSWTLSTSPSSYPVCLIYVYSVPVKLLDATKTLTPVSMEQALGSLPDVDLTGLADGDVLVYDDVSGTWQPGQTASDWSDLTGKPLVFAPDAHTHALLHSTDDVYNAEMKTSGIFKVRAPYIEVAHSGDTGVWMSTDSDSLTDSSQLRQTRKRITTPGLLTGDRIAAYDGYAELPDGSVPLVGRIAYFAMDDATDIGCKTRANIELDNGDGTATSVDIEAGGGGIKINGQPVIRVLTASQTLYIDPAGNDTTGDGSVGSPWATPHRAFEWLSNYRVQAGATITVQCNDGYFDLSSVGTLTINHVDGARVVLAGQTAAGDGTGSTTNLDFGANTICIVYSPVTLYDCRFTGSGTYGFIVPYGSYVDGAQIDIYGPAYPLDIKELGVWSCTYFTLSGFAQIGVRVTSGGYADVKGAIITGNSASTGIKCNSGGRVLSSNSVAVTGCIVNLSPTYGSAPADGGWMG